MKTGKHAPRIPFALLIGGLIAGGMSLLLLLNTASAANEVRRHDIALQDQSVAAEVQELRNEVAASAAPQNLAQAAAALGMVPALNPAFLIVAGNGTVKVLGSPAPASPAWVPPPPSTPSDTDPATTTDTATSTATSTATNTRPGDDSTESSESATPTPTPTPTPTLTLPGGNR